MIASGKGPRCRGEAAEEPHPRAMVMGFNRPSGHWAAALALAAAGERSGWRIETDDVLRYTHAVSTRLLRVLLRQLMLRLPLLYDTAYRHPSRRGVEGTSRNMASWDALCRPDFTALAGRLAGQRAVLCTQAYAAHIVLRARSLVPAADRPRVHGVATDLVPHTGWNLPGLSLLFVTCRDWEITPMVVERRATGIPVHPDFAIAPAPREESAAAGEPGLPEVLVSGGSLGLGRIPQVVAAIVRARLPVHLLVFCGIDEELARRMRRVGTARTPVTAVKVAPDGGQVPMVRRAAVYVGKAGGISMAETLACGVPQILSSVLPGQERLNAERLVSIGCARWEDDPARVSGRLGEWIGRPEERRRAAEKAASWGRPDSSLRIWEEVSLFEELWSGSAAGRRLEPALPV